VKRENFVAVLENNLVIYHTTHIYS